MTTRLVPGVAPATDEQLERISIQLDSLAARLDAADAQSRRWRDLAGELAELTEPGMTMLTGALDQAEARGYFTFARGGAAITDRIVTSFDADDLSALGENIVLILSTVKEMTQPEVLGLLRSTAVTIHDDVQDGRSSPTKPPSTLSLVRQLRDPQVRRGLNRLLSMLRTIGADPTAPDVRRTPKE